nr:RpiB/LacA/LacB family sugar-phosphate isomerase [Bacteroidota bacterium]
MFDKKHILAIGSDHAGYKLKQYIIKNLVADGYKIKDFGTNSEEGVDYPDYIHPVAKSINNGEFIQGIIICGSGQG